MRCGIHYFSSQFANLSVLRKSLLTVHVKSDGCAFASGNSQIGGHTAVVPPSIGVNRLDRQIAPCGHPLPVWKHFLMIGGQEDRERYAHIGVLELQILCMCVQYFQAHVWVCLFRFTVMLLAPSTGRPSLSHSIMEGGFAPRDTQLRLQDSPAFSSTSGPPSITGSSGGTAAEKERSQNQTPSRVHPIVMCKDTDAHKHTEDSEFGPPGPQGSIWRLALIQGVIGQIS